MIRITNDRGAQLEVLARGAVIRALRVPDRNGIVDDVVLGFERLQDYEADPSYIGCVVGRVANRIQHGRFTLDGRTVQLPINDRGNHLHGGPGGFHGRQWSLDESTVPEGRAIRLSRTSPDGEEGYPGTLTVDVTYILTNDNALIVDYLARTTEPTPINLTQHSYFNLGGGRDILDHDLAIDADYFLPVDATSIPVGVLEPVADSAFDFRTARPIRAGLGQGHAQLELCGGYDHCFVLRDRGAGPERAATLHHAPSGRTLSVLTTEPALQLYTGQFLGRVIGKAGRRYGPYAGLCLETQHFPNSPNEPAFPSVILRPGGAYRSRTIYHFGVRA